MWNWLQGKKTYLVGTIAILSALALAWDGKTSWVDAYTAILAALGAMGLRNAIQ